MGFGKKKLSKNERAAREYDELQSSAMHEELRWMDEDDPESAATFAVLGEVYGLTADRLRKKGGKR